MRASHEHYDGRAIRMGWPATRSRSRRGSAPRCDAFSAMTTDRSYRKAMPLEAAIAELRRCAGTQFDPPW